MYLSFDFLLCFLGCSVGLILPKSLSPEEKKEFEDLLSTLTHLERQPRAERPRVLELGEKSISQEEEEKTSTKVAKGIEKGLRCLFVSFFFVISLLFTAVFLLYMLYLLGNYYKLSFSLLTSHCNC